MKTFLTIFRKEFTDTIRDRRTLFFMILFPLLLMPLLLTVVTKLQTASVKKAQERVLRVAVVTHGNAAPFVQALRARTDLRVLDGLPGDSLRWYIARDSVDAAILFADDFDARVEQLQSGNVHLFFKSSDDYDMVKRRLTEVLSAFEKQLVAARFARLHLDSTIVSALRVEEHDVASVKERLGRTIGGMLPYLFVIFCFVGSMYPAIDLAAGEKERGTMETLLTAPVTRLEILLGKFAVVMLAGILSAAVSVLGILLAIRQVQNLPPEIMDAVMSILDAQTVLLVASLLFPLSVFFAAFLLALSMYARSYKEAQSLISPLTIVIIFPAMIGIMPGIALDGVTAMIPVLNVCLATKDIIAGTIKPLLLAEVYATLIALAGLSLYGCVRWFEREETIFRGV